VSASQRAAVALRRDLACPYCGGKLTIDLATEGRPYLTYEVPEAIRCGGCDAEWEPDGAARTAAKWIKWPDLYGPPAGTPAAQVPCWRPQPRWEYTVAAAIRDGARA